MHLATFIQKFGLVTILLVSGYAAWRGKTPERVCAAAVLIAYFASPFVEQRSAWHHVQIGIFIVDLSLFCVLLWLALSVDRVWPMIAAAFQGLGTLMHVAFLVDIRIWPWAYFTGEIIWSYLTLLTLAVGTYLEVDRRNRPSSPTAEPCGLA